MALINMNVKKSILKNDANVIPLSTVLAIANAKLMNIHAMNKSLNSLFDVWISTFPFRDLKL